MILRAFVAWLALMVLAIANGTFREAVLAPRLGPGGAHLASTLILCLLIVLLSWVLIGWIAPASTADALRVSGLWLLLTLAFEFGFGRLVVGRSWQELLADYNVLRGRVWILVLITIVLAPPLAARARGLLGPPVP